VTAPLLAVQGLTKSYGPRRVLDAVGLTVRPGEVLGLIGPNGAGKTTLFECLAGVLPANAGEVRSGGRPLPPAARKSVLFYIPDGIAPWPDQAVGCVLGFFRDLWNPHPLAPSPTRTPAARERGNHPPSQLSSPWMAAPLSRAGVSAGGRGDGGEGLDAGEGLDPLHLRPLLNAPVRSLSKGERKRFLLALGLLAPQPLLLLDEPFDGLDLRQTREVIGLLREAAARGKTLFLSIHQLTDAARACDRFVLLADGRVVGEGTLDELQGRAGVTAESSGLEEVFLALT
jgi:ABC-2 type transport system ATP-binding protein